MGLPGKLLPRVEGPALAIQRKFREGLSQESLLPFSGSEGLKGLAPESKARKGPQLEALGGWLVTGCEL